MENLVHYSSMIYSQIERFINSGNSKLPDWQMSRWQMIEGKNVGIVTVDGVSHKITIEREG